MVKNKLKGLSRTAPFLAFFRKKFLYLLLLSCFLPGGAVQAKRFAYVAEEGNNTLQIIDVETSSLVGEVDLTSSGGGCSINAAVNPLGTRVYVPSLCSLDHFFVIDTNDNSILAELDFSGLNPSGVAVHPSGSPVYLAVSGSLKVISADTNQVVNSIDVDTGIMNVVVSPDGSRIYVSNNLYDNVTVISANTLTVLTTINVGMGPFGLDVSPDGSRLYVANSDSDTISVINTSTNTVIDTISTAPFGSPWGLVVHPDGERIYVNNGLKLLKYDVLADLFSEITTGTKVGISMAPDGSRVYFGEYEAVGEIDTVSDTVVGSIALPVGSQPRALGRWVTGELCGNGVVQSPFPEEECDDGNLEDGDGCDSNCKITGCGNGIVTSGEACDDGNLDDGDGCDSSCEIEDPTDPTGSQGSLKGGCALNTSGAPFSFLSYAWVLAGLAFASWRRLGS